ncbi:MAG: energy transducer TonB [Lysobacterales bacterium]
MQAAIRSDSRQSIDPKRVAAWSGVLLLHVWVLGIMLLPRDAAIPIKKAEPLEVPLIDFTPVEPPPLPPPAIDLPPPPLTIHRIAPPPTVTPTPAAAPATTTVDIVVNTPSDEPRMAPGPVDVRPTGVSGTGEGELVNLRVLVKRQPAYPRRELARGIEGEVVLRVLVNELGAPQTIEVIGGTRNRNFEASAIKAIKRWKFQPYTVDGKPRAAWARVPVIYSLD